MSGPAPTPTNILKVRGSWRANSRKGEPKISVKKPSCPSWLRGEERYEWNRQVKELYEWGVIAKADRAMLASYCLMYGEVLEITELLRNTTDREEKRKLWRSRQTALDMMQRLAAKFGFDPSDRTRLRAGDTDEAGDDDTPKLRDFKIS